MPPEKDAPRKRNVSATEPAKSPASASEHTPSTPRPQRLKDLTDEGNSTEGGKSTIREIKVSNLRWVGPSPRKKQKKKKNKKGAAVADDEVEGEVEGVANGGYYSATYIVVLKLGVEHPI